ncbi:winged helix-turn-helix transcriptional regulator [Acinetobacter vivianii]
MHNAGITHNEIAKAISRTRCAVTNMIQRLVEQGQIKKELTQ